VALPPTANQIKTQLIALLTPVIGTSGTKKAKILDYLPLAFLVADTEDPTALLSPLDSTTLASGATDSRINCLLITELGFTQAPPQSDDTRRVTQPKGKNLITRRFALVYLYQFGAGSEATFSTNVEVIRTTLNSNPKLGFADVTAGLAGQGAFIERHSGLITSTMMPGSFAGRIAHVAESELRVDVIEPLGGVS